MVHNVAFPALGLSFDLNPVAFTLFGKDIYWYGIIIATGFLLAAIYAVVRSKQFGVTSDNLIDMLLVAVVFAIVGARLYYVIFNPAAYIANPIKIFFIWEGGLAIYGGVIGGVLGAWIYSRVKGVNVWKFLDIGALGLMIGQMIGRWGNFMNAEAYGQTVDGLPWGMSINSAATVHPIFLYESIWNLVGFVALHFYSKKRKFGGEIFLLYLAWYGLGRGFVESVRGADSLLIAGTSLKVSELLGFISCAVALAILIYKYVSKKRGPIGLAAASSGSGVALEERIGQLYEPRTSSKERKLEKLRKQGKVFRSDGELYNGEVPESAKVYAPAKDQDDADGDSAAADEQEIETGAAAPESDIKAQEPESEEKKSDGENS